MINTLFFFFALASCTLAVPIVDNNINTTCECQSDYVAFVNEFNRTYDETLRCPIFCKNKFAIDSHNANPSSTYQTELRWFHDLTPKELVKQRPPRGYPVGERDKSNDKFATYVDFKPESSSSPCIGTRDWVLQDRVTDIRNQGACGDCWAESATAVLESAYYQQYGKLMQLSVEQAAECSGPEKNFGCEGGWPIDVLKYVKNNSGGLCSEHDYPTTIGNGNDNMCNATLAKQCNNNITIDDIVAIPTDNEELLMLAAQNDVVSVGIDASGQGFSAYAGGIYNGMFNGAPDCSTSSLDHAVNVVGYGTDVSTFTPFYVVRNSWGVQGWGPLNGYILFQRGGNVCGVAHDAVYITF